MTKALLPGVGSNA